MEQKILECMELSCGYGRRPSDNSIIKKIGFDIKEGESIAILGPNGCGKTTLLRALGGIIPYDGSVCVDGREIRDMKRKELASYVSSMTQLSGVYFSYTVKETVMQGRYLYCKNIFGTYDKRDIEVVDECLASTGLEKLADKQIGELSGGQLQRVFLARTLAQETPILLLDEPTNHLDLKYQAELLDFLNVWKEKETMMSDGRRVRNTLIGVYHDINMALMVAEKFLLIKDGEILCFGNKEEAVTGENLKALYEIDVEAYMSERAKLWRKEE